MAYSEKKKAKEKKGGSRLMKKIIYSLLFISLLTACKEKNKVPVEPATPAPDKNPVYQRVELRK